MTAARFMIKILHLLRAELSDQTRYSHPWGWSGCERKKNCVLGIKLKFVSVHLLSVEITLLLKYFHYSCHLHRVGSLL
jgi:hypothetical protein